MPIPPVDEPLVGVNKAASRLGVGRHSVVRWIKVGVKRSDGPPVKLEGWRVGSTWKTSLAAIERFLAATNGEAVVGICVRTPAATRRASESAERELIARGA
ncbi:DUF1580 domain-containing protein [bacterium]|nr:DUF1580 domain-containing protein [bacterium]